MVSFLEYWLFFPAFFCTEQLNCSCRFIFGIFLDKKIFDPNWPFCMGYRLTKMVDFQRGLISRILAVFFSVLCTEQLNCCCRFIFGIFLEKKIFDPNCHFAWAIDLPKWSIFLKWFLFSNIGYFFQRFFAHNNLIVLVDSFLAYFWRKNFLTQTAYFAWAIDLPKRSIFKMVFFLK